MTKVTDVRIIRPAIRHQQIVSVKKIGQCIKLSGTR